jgi:hypothetical protein
MPHPFTFIASPPYVLKAIVLDVNAHALPVFGKKRPQISIMPPLKRLLDLRHLLR